MIEKYSVIKGTLTDEETSEAVRLGLRSFLKRCFSRCDIQFSKGYAEKGIVLAHSLPIFAFRDFNLEFDSTHRLNGQDSRRQMGVYVAADHNAIITSPRMPGQFIGHEQEMMPEQIEVFNSTSVLEVALKETLARKELPVARVFGFAHKVISRELDLDLPSTYKHGLFYMISERGMPLANISERDGREELFRQFKKNLNQINHDYTTSSDNKYQGIVCLGTPGNYRAVTVEPGRISLKK